MKFTGQFVGVKLDLQKYQALLDAYLFEQLKEAVKAWLKVVAGSGGRVPLWSGMARASLLEVSQLIDGRVVLSPLKVKSRVPEGRRLGTATPIIEKGKVAIRIETDVPHYNIQEYQKVEKGGSPTAPWHSREAGLLAFRASIAGIILPRPHFQPVKIKRV